MGVHLLHQRLERRPAKEKKDATVVESLDKSFESHGAAENQAE